MYCGTYTRTRHGTPLVTPPLHGPACSGSLHLSGFAAPCLARNEHHLVVVHRRRDLLAKRSDGELAPGLVDLLPLRRQAASAPST